MATICRPLDAASQPAWDAFVAAADGGTFFHRAGWRRVIEQAFRHRTHYTVAERDGAIVGLLPLVHVRSRLFGNTLISTPFCVYGGPLVADPEAAEALEIYAIDLMHQTGVNAVEYRLLGQSAHLAGDWQRRADLYVTFRKVIDGDPEVNMKAIPRKQRAMVRKGIQGGLVSVEDRDVDRLHRIYAESVRNLGTPVFSRRYFRLLADVFQESCSVLTVLSNGTPVAAVMNFHFCDQILPYYGGGTSEARSCAGNDFMYWEVMRRAASRGVRLFDFGRSKIGTGSYAFKKNWGFVAEPLHYSFRLRHGAKIPDHNPLNPKYRLFISAWKRLPLPVANVIGPHIVRGIG